MLLIFNYNQLLIGLPVRIILILWRRYKKLFYCLLDLNVSVNQLINLGHQWLFL